MRKCDFCGKHRKYTATTKLENADTKREACAECMGSCNVCIDPVSKEWFWKIGAYLDVKGNERKGWF